MVASGVEHIGAVLAQIFAILPQLFGMRSSIEHREYNVLEVVDVFEKTHCGRFDSSNYTLEEYGSKHGKEISPCALRKRIQC